jgi:serine/threonine protein kinase
MVPNSMSRKGRAYNARRLADPVVPMLAPATRLGAYTIVRKLARGGMAELFLARDHGGPEGIERLVVLKTILPRHAKNPRYVRLFLDEAKLAASLDHPHIVPVYDVGHTDGHHYFTMEYVHGQDLRSVLRRTDRLHRAMPIALAILIAREVAAALHHAHELRRPDGTPQGIVHRDVSPSNVLCSYQGAIKLADFGVAKATTSSVRTRTGTLKGKVGYMSPEQARGAAIDRRSDIFSLGVVLWELVTVRRLFKTDNDLATIQAIIHTPPPSLADLRSDCPADLERIVTKALAKDPRTRYQTAAELQHDLDELAHEVGLELSSRSLASYVTELFEPELAAWREAQASGTTVTEFIVNTEPRTPISESELSLEGGGAASFAAEPVDDELDDELDDADEIAEQITVPPLPALAGAIVAPESSGDSLDDATAIAPPPVMLEEPEPPPPPPPRRAARETNDGLDGPTHVLADAMFDAGPTALAAAPFRDEVPTVQGYRYPDESATVPRVSAEAIRSPDTLTTVLGDPVRTPPTGSPVSPNVVVRSQTPPSGVPVGPRHPPPSSAPPATIERSGPVYPIVSSGSQPPMPAPPWDPGSAGSPQTWAISDLTPQRRLAIFSAIAGGLILIVVIIAIIAGE